MSKKKISFSQIESVKRILNGYHFNSIAYWINGPLTEELTTGQAGWIIHQANRLFLRDFPEKDVNSFCGAVVRIYKSIKYVQKNQELF